MEKEKEKIEATENEVIIEEKPKVFGKIRDSLAGIPAKAKYIAAGVAGAAVVVVGTAAARLSTRRGIAEDWGAEPDDVIGVEEALDIDPEAIAPE